MTADELFEEFVANLLQDPVGYGKSSLHIVFNRIIAPHLSIPRSLRDDPPRGGFPAKFIAIKGGKHINASEFYVQGLSSALKEGYTHWIPVPDLPQPDKDEQEFEDWYETTDIKYNIGKDDLGKNAVKRGWLASRGRK